MLDPDLVSGALVQAVQSIPVVSTYFGGPAAIFAHNFLYGVENAIGKSLYEMPSPSCLISYIKFLGGNFNGMTVWKHMLELYVRPLNSASPGPDGGPPPCSTQHLLWLILNSPLGIVFPTDAPDGAPPAGLLNIRQVRLLADLLPMDTPNFAPRQDDTLTDFFCAAITIPEYGDAGLSGA